MLFRLTQIQVVTDHDQIGVDNVLVKNIVKQFTKRMVICMQHKNQPLFPLAANRSTDLAGLQRVKIDEYPKTQQNYGVRLAA